MVIPKNKKAMMDDLFDFLFTVMIAFFALLFIHAALVKGMEDKDKISLEEMNLVLKTQSFLGGEGRELLENGAVPDLSFDKGFIEKYSISLPKEVEKGGVVEVIPIDK